MALDGPVKPNTLVVRNALRRALKAGFVRLGATVSKENIAWLDEFKIGQGLSNRNDAINKLIAEHRALTSGNHRPLARSGDLHNQPRSDGVE